MYERTERRDDDRSFERTGISPALIGAIVLAILAVVFIVQNQEETRVTFLFWEGRTDVWVAIVVALLLGMILGRLLSMLVKRRRRA